MPLQASLLSRTALFAVSASLLALALRCLRYSVHHFFLRKMTILLDIDNIGRSRQASQRIKGTAVICGGSIAGLLTARICADHFEEVVVVEPEAWLDTEEGMNAIYDENGAYIDSRRKKLRGRVEQYSCAHVFQPLALQALRTLFPDFDKRVKALDGRIADAVFNVHSFGGEIMKLPREDYPDGTVPQCFFMSRESYERMLRGMVRGSSSRLRWVVGAVAGLKMAPGQGTRVDSVTVRLPSGEEQNIKASLVVDCTGRSQAGLKWLNRLRETRSVADTDSSLLTGLRIHYNSMQRYRTFRIYVPPEARARLPIPGGYENGWPWLYTYMPKPGIERKYFVADRLEGHRIEFAFGGWGDVYIPKTFAEVKDYLTNFDSDEPISTWFLKVVDILLESKEEPVVGNIKYPDLSWILYHKFPSDALPSNFVAVGDSVMVVNPTFGQGCTKACIGAITLDSQLRSKRMISATTIPNDFGRQFFRIHADKISSAWNGTKPTDYQWDTTRPVKGEKHSDERYVGEFNNIIMQLATKDKIVDSAFWHVRCFLAPPTVLLHPFILFKVILFKVKKMIGLFT